MISIEMSDQLSAIVLNLKSWKCALAKTRPFLISVSVFGQYIEELNRGHILKRMPIRCFKLHLRHRSHHSRHYQWQGLELILFYILSILVLHNTCDSAHRTMDSDIGQHRLLYSFSYFANRMAINEPIKRLVLSFKMKTFLNFYTRHNLDPMIFLRNNIEFLHPIPKLILDSIYNIFHQLKRKVKNYISFKTKNL